MFRPQGCDENGSLLEVLCQNSNFVLRQYVRAKGMLGDQPFIGQEIKTQRRNITCPRSHSCVEVHTLVIYRG